MSEKNKKILPSQGQCVNLGLLIPKPQVVKVVHVTTSEVKKTESTKQTK